MNIDVEILGQSHKVVPFVSHRELLSVRYSVEIFFILKNIFLGFAWQRPYPDIFTNTYEI